MKQYDAKYKAATKPARNRRLQLSPTAGAFATQPRSLRPALRQRDAPRKQPGDDACPADIAGVHSPRTIDDPDDPSRCRPNELESVAATAAGRSPQLQAEASINSCFTTTSAGISSELLSHVLQDFRGLSVQFMLDIDGTLYQTTRREGARVPGLAGERPLDRHRDREHRQLRRPARRTAPLQQWYKKDAERSRRTSAVPERLRRRAGDADPRHLSARAQRRRRRPDPRGEPSGCTTSRRNSTPSLIKLTAALGDVLPADQARLPTWPRRPSC